MRILYAEDSRAVAGHISSVLEAQGHCVTHVTDGQTAVDSYRQNPPDMVLMDVVMPGMDGIEATRQIKGIGSERWVPLIIMTSLSTEKELLTGFAAGADDYLTKPINLDILAARIKAMQRIALIQDSLFSIVDNVFEAIITINGKGHISSFNRAAEEIFGYSPAEIIGQNVNMLMPSPYHEDHDGYLQRYLQEGTPRIIGIGRKVSGRRKNGDIFPMELAVTEVSRPHGNLFIGLVRDISEEEASFARIKFLAHHDVLTKLPNRSSLTERLDTLLKSDRRGALLFIDLDGFKSVNDQLGHEAGDQALKIIARRLKAALKESDFIGRLGGDEFVVILDQLTSPDLALATAHALVEAVSQPMLLLETREKRVLGASIGVVMITDGCHSQTEILTAADDAMYAAKQQGKGLAVLGQLP